jgi:hypothetical protein
MKYRSTTAFCFDEVRKHFTLKIWKRITHENTDGYPDIDVFMSFLVLEHCDYKCLNLMTRQQFNNALKSIFASGKTSKRA